MVIVGLYRFTRNPMYIAVVLILLAWTIAFGSAVLAVYSLAVAISFHLRVLFYEEPRLESQFAEEWVRYKSHVPRWIGSRREGEHTSA